MSEAFIPLDQIGRREPEPVPVEIGSSSAPDEGDVFETLDDVRARSFKISDEVLPDVYAREHMIRPYPGGDYDFVAVNVPSSYQQGVIPDGEEAPHGLLRIVSAARHLHETDPEYPKLNAGLLDGHRLRLQPEEIVDQIVKTDTRVVGLNPTSVNVPEAQEIADLLDEADVPYVLGGIHATLDPALARSDFPNAAAIIRGTGEMTIGPLVEAITSGAEPDIPGVFWQESDYETVDPITETLPRTADLEPGLIPPTNQHELVEAPVYEHTVVMGGERRHIKEANLFVTYGCPFECTFCASPVMVGRQERNGQPAYRRPDMERILDDVEHVVEDLHADAIHFLDDMAFISPGQITEFYQGLQDRDLAGRMVWRGLTRAPVVNKFREDAMQDMRDSGAWKIALGVESGSDEVLEGIKKKVTTDQVREAVTKLNENGIQSKGFFIFGFPGETEEQMLETRAFILELRALGMTEISAFQFKPYPGTEAFEQLVSSRPDILPQLSYLRRLDKDRATSKAAARASDTPWLPDDLTIAAVPSGRVREHVEAALKDFYPSRTS